MEFHRQIKKNARASLKGCWGQAIAIFFTIIGVYLLISALEQALYFLLGLSGFQDVLNTPDFYLDDELSIDLWSVLCTGFSSLLLFLAGTPLTAGSAGWYFRLSAGSADAPLGFEGLFIPFTSGKRYLRTLGAAFILGFRSVLWGMLFLVPPACMASFFQWAGKDDSLPFSVMLIDLGSVASWILFSVAIFALVIFLQRYYLVYYLLADRPQTPVLRIVSTSVKMMKGHKWEAFSLKLSFLGWQMLSILVLPMLYVMPFYYASMAIYARYVIESFQRFQMGDIPFQPGEETEPEFETGPLEDDGKTKEYAFSDLQEQMRQK